MVENDTKNTDQLINIITFAGMIGVFILFFWCYKHGYFLSVEPLQKFIVGFGIWGPIVFILLQIIQVIVPIVPGVVLLEALSMKIPSLVRDIPIYEELIDGEDIYKGKDFMEFQEKIKGILNAQLPSLVENGYKVAEKRNIKEIGRQLKLEYKNLLF